MPSMPSKVLAQDTMVRELLRPLLRFLSQPGATEIVINRPGEVYVEVGASWKQFDAPDLTFVQLMALATAIATYTEQEIGPQKPMLSAMLPDGERVQIVLPPAVEVGTLSFSIRRPSAWIKSLEEYEQERPSLAMSGRDQASWMLEWPISIWWNGGWSNASMRNAWGNFCTRR